MFKEKTKELLDGREVPVFQTPKYIESREKAMEIIQSEKYGITEGDFWILMNGTKKKDKMLYSGLIISHNGCLKINDKLPDRFDPHCVTCDKSGYNDSLVFTYCNQQQGVYEVGEVSSKNCRNDYPYAMAYKRLFDRVVLKLSKLAYAGIYSDSESDEFAQQYSPDVAELNQETCSVGAKRAEILTKIKQTKWSEEKLDAASMKTYGVTLMKLTDDQLKEVLEKITEQAVSNGTLG